MPSASTTVRFPLSVNRAVAPRWPAVPVDHKVLPALETTTRSPSARRVRRAALETRLSSARRTAPGVSVLPPAMLSRRGETASLRVSAGSVPQQPPCQDWLASATSSNPPSFCRRSGPPASPAQMASSSVLPSSASVVPETDWTVNAAVCRVRGAHSSLVRPKPTTVSSSPGAGAVVANGTGVVPATGEARRARTRSRSVRGTSSTTSTVVPAAGPRTAVVLHCGLPAATGPAPRSSAKQLAAVASHWAATSTPEQARWSSPMRRRAVEAWPPSVTAGPVAAWTGPTTRQPAATAMAVRPAVTAARERNLDTGRYSVLSGGGMTGGRSTDDMGIRQDEDAPRRARPSRRSAEHGPAHLDGARKQPCPRQARRPPPSSLPAPLARRPRTYHHVHNSNTASTSSR